MKSVTSVIFLFFLLPAAAPEEFAELIKALRMNQTESCSDRILVVHRAEVLVKVGAAVHFYPEFSIGGEHVVNRPVTSQA